MSDKESVGSNEKAASPDGELAKPPSVLWLVIPLILILAYAALR